MEQQLRLWLQQQFELSNDYASWAAITRVIVLILAIAVILHLTLHKGLLPYIERRTGGAQRPWGALITRTRLFNRFAFLIQGIVFNIQALIWLGRGSAAQEILTTGAQAWCLLFGMLLLFSVMDILQNLSRHTPSLSRLPLRGIDAEPETDYRGALQYPDYFAADRKIPADFTERTRCHDRRADAGL